MLGARSLIFDCPKGRNFDFRSDLPFEFSLEFHVAHVQVHIVLGQLVLDVERSVIACVEFIRVERARRTQCIGVGVDVEIAFDGSEHRVYLRRERSRCTLFAVRSVADEVQRQLVLENVLRGIDQKRVAVHLALDAPSRIDHRTDGSVIRAFFTARGDAGRVAVLNAVAEEFLEPVGIAKLRLSQVGVAPFGGVQYGELPCGRVVGVDQLRQLAVDAAFRAVNGIGIVEPSLVVHLLVDGHLLLRIHDVEVRVAGNHTHREFAGVTDFRNTGRAFLRGDDDDSGHGAGAVDRGCRTILENLETLDVIGVKSGDGRTDERRGVARRQGIGVDVDHILHDHTVHHPQRLRVSEDRRSAANADFRGGAESSGNVLHGHAGRTAFKTAADFTDAVQFDIRGQ